MPEPRKRPSDHDNTVVTASLSKRLGDIKELEAGIKSEAIATNAAIAQRSSDLRARELDLRERELDLKEAELEFKLAELKVREREIAHNERVHASSQHCGQCTHG